MAHVLAKLHGVTLHDIRHALERDAAEHAKEGLFLEHIWKNANEPDEIYFLFRTDNLAHAQHFIEETHTHARRHNPAVNLPEMKFLEE